MSAFKGAARLLFLGAPGAGKGTYATRLSKAWNIPHISTGDIIRAEIKSGSELGKTFKDYNDRGALVPDELVVAVAKKRLQNEDCKKGYILDGFPRTVPQGEQLEQFSPTSLCLNVALPDKYLIDKMAGRRVCRDCGANYNLADIRDGDYDMPPLLPKAEDCEKCKGNPPLFQRSDDTEEVVTARLKTYVDETAPLISFYEKQNKLVTFDVKKGVKDYPLIEKMLADKLNL